MQGVYTPTPRVDPIRRTAFDMLALFFLLLRFAAIALTAVWGFWHTSRIFTGVTVGGVPIGGMTRAEAVRQLNGELYDFPLPPDGVSIRWPDPPLEQELRQAIKRAEFKPALAINPEIQHANLDPFPGAAGAVPDRGARRLYTLHFQRWSG